MFDEHSTPNRVDARGLPCPQPVILTRKAMKESAAVITIVDNETAQRNVTRMAEKSGAPVAAEERADGIYLHITAPDASETETPSETTATPAGKPLVLVIPSEFMGRGEAELGHILIRGFFHTLGEVESLPDTIIFLNSGVKLVVEGSPVIDDLIDLGQRGVEMMACGTCLGYHEMKDQVSVGMVSNMYTIAETILGAGKVVNL